MIGFSSFTINTSNHGFERAVQLPSVKILRPSRGIVLLFNGQMMHEVLKSRWYMSPWMMVTQHCITVNISECGVLPLLGNSMTSTCSGRQRAVSASMVTCLEVACCKSQML